MKISEFLSQEWLAFLLSFVYLALRVFFITVEQRKSVRIGNHRIIVEKVNKSNLTPQESEEILRIDASDLLSIINRTSYSNQEKQDLLRKALLEIAEQEKEVGINGSRRI